MQNKLDWEQSQAVPTTVPDRSHDGDVIATLGDPMLRDAMDRAMLIRSIYGDNEAFLADAANEIVANLQVIAATWRDHPERVISSMLGNMDNARRSKTITLLREVIDQMESDMVPDLPENPVPVMNTGTRSVDDPVGVLAGFRKILRAIRAKNPDLIGVSGGAVGSDTLFAQACIAEEILFTLYLPNWAYPLYYSVDATINELAASPFCLGIVYAVERPEFEDWHRRWGAEKWWTDNFVRNDMMVEVGKIHTICGPNRPEVIFNNPNIKGGTAACVRSMRKHDVTEAIYMNSENPDDIVKVTW